MSDQVVYGVCFECSKECFEPCEKPSLFLGGGPKGFHWSRYTCKHDPVLLC